jgi:rhodanese-related sulfurtransferase
MPAAADKRLLKDAVYAQLARVTKALASPKRLEMLDLLCQKTWTVDELAREMQLSIANASQHLKVLGAAQLVSASKKGLFVHYSVSQSDVAGILRGLRLFAESHLPEIERVTRNFAAGREEFASLDRDTLLRRVRDGSALLLDVRPEAEFRTGHLRGALSIPLDQLRRRLSELPQNRQIVAYCRGPYCLFASDAVRTLRRNGFNAIRYEEGVSDWLVAGLPVEMSDHSASSGPATATRSRPRRKQNPNPHNWRDDAIR